MESKKSMICFGEVLWDIFPERKVVGGAPLNVTFHANSFSINAQIISATGNDELGTGLRDFFYENKIKTDLLYTNHTFPTGTVQVTLDEKGSASYEIVKPVAWDFLDPDSDIEKHVSASDILLFGSLSCRNKSNYQTLLQLIEKAKKTVFDVNLRPPFYEQALIEDLLKKANIVKMNDEELEEIIGWYGKTNDIKQQMSLIKDKFNIETLIVTAGKDGAYCTHDNIFYHQKGFPVTVKDTVGSGDAFLAAFIFKMFHQASWQECLKFACATGALVATKAGGTPTIKEDDVLNFIQNKRTISV